MQRRRWVPVAIAAAGLAAAPALAADANPLIGTWKAQGKCVGGISFTPTSQTAIETDVFSKSKPLTVPVTYKVSGKTVSVVLPGGLTMKYKVLAPDRIQQTANPGCVYLKQR